jgi:sporulation protein YlmC with PRC-barrel domain
MLTRTILLAAALTVQMPGAVETATKPADTFTEESAARWVDHDRLYFYDIDVDALMRARVIDRDGQVVGSVAELMVSGSGRITDAVVRLTGGMLGVTGEQVTVSFDALQIEDAGANGHASFVLHAEQTQQEIAAMPRFVAEG